MPQRTVRLLLSEPFQAFLDAAPDAMVVADRDGCIATANRHTRELFGYSAEELVGRPIETLVPVRFRERHMSHRAGYAEDPHRRPMGTGLDLWGLRKDGTEFPVAISLSPMHTDGETVVVAAIRDITDRKQIETALQEKNAELERASRVKDRLLAGISHELRTPLNAIIGFTGTLLMRIPGPLNADQEEQLSTVQTSARHLLSLINDLLDLAKVDSGNVELAREPVNCQSVLNEVLSALRPLADAKTLRLAVKAPKQPVVVESNRRALTQIVINLTNNAVKFTDRGEVCIELARTRQQGKTGVDIRITDTGRGIRPEDQHRLFGAFQQGDTPSGHLEGTGLGLHLSQRLATLLGGRISFESEVGRGSTFTLTLPAGA